MEADFDGGTSPGTRRARRLAARKRTRSSWRRRSAMAVVFVLICAVGWFSLAEFDQITEVNDGASGQLAVDNGPSGQNAAISAVPTPLDEPGGLVTGPGGLRQGTTDTVIDNRVVMVGDSVMQAAAPYVPELMPAWSVVANTRVGRFLPEATKVVSERLPDGIGHIVVLNLGNNYGKDRAQFSTQVDEMLALLANTEHVVWITSGEYQKGQHEVNDVLREKLATHPNLVLVDWNGVWKQHPEYTGADNIHLTPEGTDAYAKLIVTGLGRITAAAKETPEPNPAKPQINTRGSIPASGKAKKKSYAPTTRPSSGTTVLGSDAGPPTTAASNPPDTSEPPVTIPPVTAAPPTSPPPTAGP